MADYWTQFSVEYVLPKNHGKDTKALDEIIAASCAKFAADEELDESCPYYKHLIHGDDETIWFNSEESDDVALLATVIEDLQEALKDDRGMIVSWGNTCSKLRTDGFGGGAALIRRGLPTIWLNPERLLEELAQADAESPELQRARELLQNHPIPLLLGDETKEPALLVAAWREAVVKGKTYLSFEQYVQEKLGGTKTEDSDD